MAMFHVEHQKNPSSMKNKKTDSKTDSNNPPILLTKEILDLCIQRKMSPDDAVSSIAFAACKIMAVSRGISMLAATQMVARCLLGSARRVAGTAPGKRRKK